MKIETDSRGLTLVESLISIVLISVLILGVMGAFFISRLGTDRARHRIAAMNVIKEYMEREARAGYLGGYVDGDYYFTVDSGNGINFTIDDRGTATFSDDLIGTIRPNPYPGTASTIGSVRYKKIGFTAEWDEQVFQTGAVIPCVERIVTYVADHS